MNLNNFLLLIILLFTRGIDCVGQNQTVHQKLTNFAIENLQEKIFLHTDKDVYVAGEKIWFKAYNVDGTFHKPLQISRVAYIELIDAKLNAVAQAKIELKDASGNGFLETPDLGSGSYTIRAYTRWMRNFAPSFFFHKEITIIAPGSELVVPPTAAPPQPHLDFFPEGGNLVSGLRSKIAFKVLSAQGIGLEANGFILNHKNDTIVTFETLRYGMGSFFMTPSVDETYKAVYLVQGHEFTATLPKVQSRGYVMTVTSNDLMINVRVSYAGESLGNEKTHYILAHTRQFPIVSRELVFSNNQAELEIPKSLVKEGITHITLFDNENIPVAERLLFTRPQRKLSINASLNKKQFLTREQIFLNVSSMLDDRRAVADLSLSVFKIDSLQETIPLSIHSYLLLTSDLKGIVESPDYYLESFESSVHEATENLMLTHGWRRFSWSQVMAPIPKHHFTPELEGMIIEGKVTPATALTNVSDVPLLLAIFEKNTSVIPSKTDGKGKFQFYVKDLRGNKNIVVANRSNFLVTYNLQDPFEDKKDSVRYPARITSKNSAQERSLYTQITQTRTQNEDSLRDVTVSHKPYIGKTIKYKMSDYVIMPGVVDILREYVPEAIVRSSNGKQQIFLLDKDKNVFFTEEPLLLVDGLPIVNSAAAIAASAKDVESIEILPKKYFDGPLEYSGIIHIRTAQGDLSGFALDSTTYVFAVQGYQLKKEFYNPHYATTDQRNSRMPDFRNVLYWNPEVYTNTQRDLALKFTSGDNTGKFLGVIQGISPDGVPGVQTFTFDVFPPPRQ